MMSDHKSYEKRGDDGHSAAVRVRITAGPDHGFVGKIGYLFESSDDAKTQYIITVTPSSDVRRLHLQDGYKYQVEEI